MPNKRKTIEEIVSDAQKGTPLPKATQSHTKAGAERVAELSRMTLDEALEQGGHTRRPGVPLPKATQLMPTTRPRVYGLSNQTVRFDSTDAGSTFGTYLPKAAQTTHGAGGRVNADERAKRQKTTVLDVLGNPMYYASKAQEAVLDPITDTAWRLTHPNAAKARDEERQKANAQLKEAEKPTLGKTVGGMVVKGADQAVTGITSTADWLLGNAMRELGWENNPISTLNRAAQANKAANEEYYAKNLANASKAVKIADELGTATVAAVPDLVIAYLTGGGSLAAEGSGALAKGGAKLAGREAAAQTQNVVKRVTSEMYRNPQFWTSFARVAGPGYEQAKADGASEWEANMYALANGIMNAAVEVGGGIQNLPKELQKTTNAIWTWIKSSAEEGTEEVVQGVIERGLQNLIYGKQNPLVSVEDESAVFNPLTAAKEFGGGFAVGSILGGGPAIANIRSGIERGRVQNALAAAQESAENAARAERERAKLGKAAPALRLDNPLPTAAQQSAMEVLQDATAGKPVSEQGIKTVLKDRNLTRQWMAAMGQETSESISDADLETVLRNTIARQTGQETLTMDAETRARYDAATTETAKTGILYGVSDADIQSAERLGQVTGRRVVFFSEEGRRDGYYDKRTGVLHINAKSENPVAQIVAHELTHSTEMAEDYAKLAQHIMRKLAKDGNLETLQTRIREIYDSHEVELSSEDLDHEVVAYFVEHNLLTDEESIVSLVQEDRTLGQRILAMLDRILSKLGSKSAGERTFIREARDLYAKALEGSSITSAQQIQDLNDQLRRGEITEAEYDAAFDRVYNAEDALRADVQNSFAGPRAKTADLEQLRTAKAMLEEDVDPETIRQQTGWFQGADGKWRIEIDDSGMRLIPHERYSNINKLSDLIEHQELFEQYPEMKDMLVFFEGMEDGRRGNYDPQLDLINLSQELKNDPQQLQETLLHEIQHAIQSREGFAKGSSAKAWDARIQKGYDNRTESTKAEQRRLQEQMNQLREEDPEFFDEFAEFYHSSPNVPRGEIDWDTLEQIEEDPPEWQEWDARRDALEEKYGDKIWSTFRLFDAFRQIEMNPTGRRDPRDLYWNTAGEIEARDTASRMDMSAEERKNTPPDTGDENTVFADEAQRADDFIPGDIDEETVQKGIQEVAEMDSVSDISGTEFSVGEKDLITQVSEFFDRIGNTVFNSQLGDVTLNRRGVKDDIAHGIGRNKAAAFAAVPDVLEKGRVIDFQKNWKGRGLDTAVIASPITINGEPYLAGVVLHRSNSENKFYLHEVLTEKNEALPFKTGTSKGTPGGNAPSIFSLLQKVREVKLSNGVPAPPKSSTLQNSFSAPAETGVPLPKAGAENVSQEERLPKKAQNYIQRARRFAMEKIANAMSIPKAAQREFLRGPLTEATEEYLKTGKISEKTRGKLFQAAWDEGRVVLDDFYNQYKDVKDTIRKTALNIKEVRRDFADFGDFVKRNRGTLRLVKEGGMGIDAFYEHTLHPMAPDLFPMTFTNEADQLRRIEEIAHSIVKVEKSLDEHWGREADDFRTWAENDFEAAMDELAGELARAKRYEADKTETKVEPITAETVTQAYKDLKEQRRTYEKASARNLLTDADEIAVGRILRGEDSVEGLDPKKYNVKGIRDVVEAKREYEKTARRIRDYKAQQKKARRDMADTYLGTVMAWKDKKTGVQYSRETMERNIRDIVANKEDAKKIIEAYFTPVHAHEAAATRMKNEFRQRVQGMNLSRKIENGNTVSEAHAVQLLGEATDNMRYLEQHKRVKDRDGKTYEEWQTVVNTLWATSPKLNRAKIEGAVEEFRAIYDELFQQMNEVRIRNGYEPINYRRGYFPHFQPGDSSGLLEQFSRALGISADVTSLPTTINGLTHQFRPGIRWFGNAQERLGFNTTYDAVEGFDKYIEGAADVIHHTDDIQNLRALSDQIRYRSSDKGVREQVDRIRRMDNLTDAEKQTLINETYDKGKYHLSNFVVELEEYTNLLANKRSRRDRDMEQLLGRNMYNLAKRFESRVAANMVAINPGSWLTNFIPLTQGWTTTDSRYMLQGMWESLRAIKTSDGMLEMSDFLTNRKGSEPLVKMWEQSSKAPNAWQKVSAFGGRAGEILSSPMEYIDQFTAGSLVRARYHQNVARGMSEDASIHEADAWAAGIMADRSKGSTPTVFNQQNPLKKVFTQFQLEVNNELSWLAKDVPDELKEKTLGAAALAIFKFLIGTYLFNDLYEALVGRRSALDPLGILNDTVGDLTGYKMPNLVDLASGRDGFETEKKDLYDTAGDVGKEVAENLPFIGGVLGGGRVPISSALPSVKNVARAIGQDGLNGKKRAQIIGKELGNSASYVVLPFGGSQLRKIVQGTKAVAEGGSFSMDNDGNKLMQYPVYNDTPAQAAGNAAKAILFGKSALPGARQWVESGFDTFSKKETAAYQDLTKSGVKQEDAYNVLKQLHEVTGDKKKDQKSAIIRKSKLTDDQKQALYESLLVDKDSKQGEKFTAMRKAGMTWDQVMDAYDKYREYNDSEGGKSSTRATEFSAWLDDHLTERQAEVAKEQLKIWAMMPASTDRYEKMRDLGLNSSDAIKLSETLTALEPAEGKSEPTDIQKYQAIVSSGISDEAKAAGIKSVMRKDVLPKYEAAEKYKISPDDYVAAYAKVIELREKYGKSQVNAAIAKEAIDSIPGLTKKQRAALWQVQKKNFNPSQNPYDVTVGQIVYNIQYGLDGNAVVLP